MSEFSTFADGIDCRECNEYEKEIQSLKSQLEAANKEIKKLDDYNFNDEVEWLRNKLKSSRAVIGGLLEPTQFKGQMERARQWLKENEND